MTRAVSFTGLKTEPTNTGGQAQLSILSGGIVTTKGVSSGLQININCFPLSLSLRNLQFLNSIPSWRAIKKVTKYVL